MNKDLPDKKNDMAIVANLPAIPIVNFDPLPNILKPAAALFAASIGVSYALQKSLLCAAPKNWVEDLNKDYRARLSALANPETVKARLITSLPIGLALFLLTLPKTHLNTQILPTAIAIAVFIGHLLLRELYIFRDKKWLARLTYPITRRLGKDIDLEDFKIPLRPIFLWGAYFVAPFALLMMMSHSIRELLGHPGAIELNEDYDVERLQLRQCVSKEELTSQNTFFMSRAFTWTTLALFVSGVPAMAALAVYNLLNIDKILGYPSHDPNFFKSAIFIGLYISSVGWCICSLFFRAYFTFPLNFASTEYDVVVDSDGILKTGFKGWFGTLMYWPIMDAFERRIRWSQLAAVKCSSGKLRPLPETIFSKDSLIYKALDKVAALSDAMGERLGRKEELLIEGEKSCLVIADPRHASKGDLNLLARTVTLDPAAPQPLAKLNMTRGKSKVNISVRLWELSKEEKAKLYYALRKWSPEVHLTADVQEKLIGSTVMRDPRYTDIWFNLLTANPKRLKYANLKSGDKLRNGEYEIESKLDSGGQAVVYSARSPARTSFVIKEFVLPAGEGLDALVESAADFENESTILGQLSHPKIVKLYDMFIEDHRVYLVLEKVDGSSLRKLVKENGPFGEEETISLSLQMCEILSYLHGLVPPLVHRDFTPDNLILSSDGDLKLIDFSLAQQAKADKQTECAGKHSYTPPEQFRAEACPQSDIYAMGATLYYLLTGSDPTPIIQSHPKDKVPTISEALDSIVAKATTLDLSTRYESTEWLKLDLKTLVQKQLKVS